MMEFVKVYLSFWAIVIGLTGAFFAFATVMYCFVIYPAEVIKNMFDKNHPDYWRRI